MSGITDTVFRQLMREMGADVVISDLISAEGLVRGGERTRSMMAFVESERPVGIQLFGGNEDSLVEAARMVEASGADFVDLNLGCPVNKVVKTGGGSAWLREPAALGKLLVRMKAGLSVPLTIKVRTGWDEGSINVDEVVHVAHDSGVSWVAIHGRTRAQGYAGLSNWDLIKGVASQSPLPIIGNGDVLTAEQAWAKIHGGYSHGVMIGRGALKNPWIFLEILGRAPEGKDLSQLIERHFGLALGHKDPRRAFLSLKKFCGWYAAGLPGSSLFRKRIFETSDVECLRRVTLDYFGSVDTGSRQDEGGFLMGGHG